MKKNKYFFTIFIFFLTFFSAKESLSALDLSGIHNAFSDYFYNTTDSSEGSTSFRSLLIPSGGRSESLGSAYTGLSNDISFFDFNPSASSILEQTEISVFHNSWIADSNVDSLAATFRIKNAGLGAKVTCFYIPFSEYDAFGTKVASNYYSETTFCLNGSYVIYPGYTFKGVAIGLNAKAAYRSIPDFTDNDTGAIIPGSGLEQSGIAFMGDVGIMMQFNIGKFFYAREANFRLGISACNLGVALTSLNSASKLDDGLPSSAAIGISYKPVKPVTICLEFRQPFNLMDFGTYQLFSIGTGVEVSITNFFSALAGFQLKGGNPRISLGAEFEAIKMRFNVNYSLDLSTSFTPVNRISLSAKLPLGDQGRKEKRDKVDMLYNQGVSYFAEHNYEEAINCWTEALKIDKYFDPASTGLKSAVKYKKLLESFQTAFPNQTNPFN